MKTGFTTERLCYECREVIRGRTDKKFCSDQCRNTFNNHRYRNDNKKVYRINRILKKNRSILREFSQEGKNRIDRDSLLRKGYHFEYCTGFRRSPDGEVLYYCYDQVYKRSEEQQLTLLEDED